MNQQTTRLASTMATASLTGLTVNSSPISPSYTDSSTLTNYSHTNLFSPLILLHRFVECKRSSHLLTIHPHFLTNASVTSQFIGSHGNPQTKIAASVFLVSQNAWISRHSSSSSKFSSAAIILSRMRGNGNISNHG